MITLRQYQIDGNNAVAVNYAKGIRRQLRQLPTGSGKTIEFCSLTHRYLQKFNKSVLICVHRDELYRNTRLSLYNHFNINSEGIVAGRKHVPYSKAYVAMVETLNNKLTKRPKWADHIGMLIIDECLPYDQFISHEKGKTKIGVLVSNFEKGKSIPKVYSLNEKTGKCELKNIVDVKRSGEKEILKINLGKAGFVKSSTNHKFLTTTGWLRADELNVGDAIITTAPTGAYLKIPNDDQLAVIYGGILGDASVDSRVCKNINRIRFIHGELQRDYISWKANIFGKDLSKIDKNGFSKKIAFRFTTDCIYIQDNLLLQEKAIENITAKSLAVAWMDDGSIAKKLNNYGTLCSTARSLQNSNLLQKKLKEKFNIISVVVTHKSSSTGNEYYFLRINKSGILRLSELIAPYIHESMSYKIHYNYRHLCGSYVWDTQYSERGCAVVKNIEHIGKEETFDIQVEDNENFVLPIGKRNKIKNVVQDGIIAHNCHIGNFKKLYDFFPDALIVGVTATPISAVKSDPLKNHFDTIISGPQIDELIQYGSLCPNETYSLKGIDPKKFGIKRGEYDQQAMGKAFGNSRNVNNTVEAYTRLCEGKKTIVFNVNVEHSLLVNDAFIAAGYPSKHIDGTETKTNREEIFTWFKNTPNAILQNVGIATTGFDEPSIINVIVNKSTLSLPLWLQMTGRGSRPYPGKDFFRIIDMGANVMTHGDWSAVRDWEQIFYHPEKPSNGGVAPIKSCDNCEAIIPASAFICKFCGHEHERVVNYDTIIADFQLIVGRINISSIVKEAEAKNHKPFKPFFDILNKSISILKHRGGQNMDDDGYNRAYDHFEGLVKEWCSITEKPFSKSIKTFSHEQFFKKVREELQGYAVR